VEAILMTAPALQSPETAEHGHYKIPALLALSEVAASLASGADVEALLARYLGTMMRIAGAQAGTVRVLAADGAHLRLVGSVGLPPELVERERLVSLECGTCGDAVRMHAALCSHALERCGEATRHPFFLDFAELFAVPIRLHGTTLGVFNLFMRRAGELPEEVRSLFGAIGEHLGMALENARLTRENTRATVLGERQMLANQVHDSLAQTLAYAKMRTIALREAEEQGDPERAARYLADLEDALEVAYRDLRGLIAQFREPMDPRGLAAALRDAIEAFRRRTGLDVELAWRMADLALAPEEEVQVFYVVQEALANVQRHAGARRVRVEVDRDDRRCVVTIEDDGSGFESDQPAAGGHFGLAIMRERAARIGGALAVDSRPGGGTRVRLTLPVRA
jgi:two-component system nitrate/nitrite sensor histidine kinase NarX